MLETLIGSDILQYIRIGLDIGLLSILFYIIYRLFRVVKIPLLFRQIGLIVFTYIIATLLNLEAVLWVLQNILGWVVIGGIVIFQSELRALVFRSDYIRFFRGTKKKHDVPNLSVITDAILYLQKYRRGALLVFQRNVELEHIVESTVKLDAALSAELIQTIFSHDTVLHDGAIIIQGNIISHAGCFLPINKSSGVYDLGSRHRAALGLSQNSDAIILVLSEEKTNSIVSV